VSDTGVIVTLSPRDCDAVLLARRDGTWSIEQTAIANSIEVNRRREAGWPVKVPVHRPGAAAMP
jgi:hypothetical protein